MVRFADNESQLKGRDIVKDEKTGLSKDYVNAMMYASRAPRWIQALGLRAMPLGLDLRGGLYLLYQVDVERRGRASCSTPTTRISAARCNAEKITFTDISTLTVDSDIPNGLRVLLPAGADRAAGARGAQESRSPISRCRDAVVAEGAAVDCVLTEQQVRERRDFAITSNITTLRNRVNELGVSEPIVQRQGPDRIVVQLPGVQNSAEVKDMLGKVATLEYRLVDPRPHHRERPRAGRRQDLRATARRPARSCSSATSSSPATSSSTPRRPRASSGPQIDVTLDSAGGEEMLKTTRANLGKPHGRGVHRAAPRNRRGRRQAGRCATSRKRRSSTSRPSTACSATASRPPASR